MIRIAIPTRENAYPRLKNIKTEICFLVFRVEPDNSEMAAMLAAKGQGCIVVIMPRNRHPVAVMRTSFIIYKELMNFFL